MRERRGFVLGGGGGGGWGGSVRDKQVWVSNAS